MKVKLINKIRTGNPQIDAAQAAVFINSTYEIKSETDSNYELVDPNVVLPKDLFERPELTTPNQSRFTYDSSPYPYGNIDLGEAKGLYTVKSSKVRGKLTIDDMERVKESVKQAATSGIGQIVSSTFGSYYGGFATNNYDAAQYDEDIKIPETTK